MKKQLLLFVILMIAVCYLPAQNVGIGTTNPQSRLEVKDTSKTKFMISSKSYVDTTQLILSNRANNTLGTDFLITAKREQGLFFTSQSDLAANTNDSLFTIRTSGNAGIGTKNPTERLDVNGNINLAGTIKANGVDGTANQVLMKNNSGNMVWGDLCDLKNKATFIGTGINLWTVPAGVTKIVVECWGAGGGGNGTGAGGGGGYIAANLNVTPGNTVTSNIGTGGSGGALTANSGSTSFVAVGAVTVTAYGGSGATYEIGSKTHSIANGGEYNFSAGFTSYQGMVGEAGDFSRIDFVQVNTGAFYEVCEGGRGGNAANTIATGGRGRYSVYSSTGAASKLSTVQKGLQPGGGGGGGKYNLNDPFSYVAGGQGGNGMVIIHY